MRPKFAAALLGLALPLATLSLGATAASADPGQYFDDLPSCVAAGDAGVQSGLWLSYYCGYEAGQFHLYTY